MSKRSCRRVRPVTPWRRSRSRARSKAWPHNQVRRGGGHLAGRLQVWGHASPARGGARPQGLRPIERGRSTASPPWGPVHNSIQGPFIFLLFTQRKIHFLCFIHITSKVVSLRTVYPIFIDLKLTALLEVFYIVRHGCKFICRILLTFMCFRSTTTQSWKMSRI